MSGTITQDDITNFLGNVELHVLTVKFHWQAYINTQDPNEQAAAKQAAIDAVNIIQQILITVAPPLGITLATTPLTAAQLIQFGITPKDIPTPAPQPSNVGTGKKERTKWQKRHGLAPS